MFKKIVFLFLSITSLAGVFGGIEAIFAESWQQVLNKSSNLEGYYYQTSFKFSDHHMGTMEVWSQGYARRVEMVNASTGEKMVLLTRQSEGTFYQIDSEAKEAIAYTYADVELLPQDLDESRYAVAESRFDQNFIDRVSSVKEEEYNGQSVFLLENKSTHGGQEEIYRVWISKKYGLPLKEEMEMADGRIHGRTYEKMIEGPFPQTLFELPEDIKVIKQLPFN